MTEDNELVDYSGFLDDKLRIAHEHGSLEYVPSEEAVDLSDDLVRYNLKKQVKRRKKVMAGLHSEIKELEELLNQ